MMGTETSSHAPPEKARGGAAPAPEGIAEPPRHVLRWPGDSIETAFRLIPAGSFRMGSRGYDSREEPAHVVRIAEPFWMAETPVTQAELLLFTRSNGVKHQNHFRGCPRHPAENLDWRLALRYCDWLTRERAADFPECFGLACLPTEAEWEYACRAGTETEYHTGDGPSALAEAGWFDEYLDKGSTHAVRLKAPNAFHLHDMHGNVWEWCHDAWDETAYRARVDGEPDAGGRRRREEYRSGLESMLDSDQTRVSRGGSWLHRARDCRSARRVEGEPGHWSGRDGFRVCLVRGSAGTEESGAEPRASGDGGRGPRPEADGAVEQAASRSSGRGRQT
jgi:formylglycine-generating enzyme required for sulfatase activity